MAEELKIRVGIIDDASTKLVQIGDKVKATGEKISGAGSKLTASLTAPIALVAGAGVKAFADFETSMSNVSTLIDTNVESMDEMSDSILSIAMRVPVATTDLSAALYDVRSAGISAAEAMDVLESSAVLGVAGLGSTQEATNLLTTAINAFGLQGRDSNEVADVLFKTVKAGKTNISQLAGAFGKMAGNAKAANIEFEDVQAATAAITALTGKTSEAQNALAQVFLELTIEGGKLDKALEENGKSLEYLNDTIGEKGLVKGMKAVQEEMGLSETQFKNMFSSAEGGTAVFQLLTDAYDMNNAALDNMLNGGREMEEAFLKQKETVKSQWQLLKNQLGTVLIEIGSIIVPKLVEAMDWLTIKLSRLGDWIGNLSPFWQDFILKAALVVAAIGPLLMIIGGVISTVGTLITVVGGLASVLAFIVSPIGLVIAALGALVAAGVWLYKNWEEVSNFASAIWDGIVTTVNMRLDAIADSIVAVMNWISETWTAGWNAISAFFSQTWESIKFAADVIFSYLSEQFYAFVDWLWSLWYENFTKVYNFFAEVWDKALLKSTQFWEKFFELVGLKLKAFGQLIETAFNNILKFFDWLWNTVYGIVKTVFDRMIYAVTQSIEILQNSFANFGAGVANLFSNVWAGIKNVFITGINWVIDKINWVIEQYNKLPFAPQIGLLSRVGEGGGGGGGPQFTAAQALAILRPETQLATPASSTSNQSSYQVNVSGNNFYGNDAGLANQVASTIMSDLKASTNAQR